ncbi:MAG TPA: thermonuclease family protein [Alphaproteobacteria bacterium]|nr:thermonuclease family protein [Alphaproteobacteria bacterium]
MTRCHFDDRRLPAPRRLARWAAIVLTGALVAPFPVHVLDAGAAELKGPAHVVDGNRITIGANVVRLYGIDAPDEDQMCERRGAAWRCGQDAGWALAERLERHWVLCETRAGAPDPDASDAVPAVCYLEGRQIDVNAWMVVQGWALADPDAAVYAAEQQTAERAGRGLWAGKFDPPWEWRKRSR